MKEMRLSMMDGCREGKKRDGWEKFVYEGRGAKPWFLRSWAVT